MRRWLDAYYPSASSLCEPLPEDLPSLYLRHNISVQERELKDSQFLVQYLIYMFCQSRRRLQALLATSLQRCEGLLGSDQAPRREGSEGRHVQVGFLPFDNDAGPPEN